MNQGKVIRAHRLAAHRKMAAETLKRCPLCGAINALINDDCYVCMWHGTFDFDPGRVEEGLGELLIRCPELAEAMMETPVIFFPPVSGLRGLWHRLGTFFSRYRKASHTA